MTCILFTIHQKRKSSGRDGTGGTDGARTTSDKSAVITSNEVQEPVDVQVALNAPDALGEAEHDASWEGEPCTFDATGHTKVYVSLFNENKVRI